MDPSQMPKKQESLRSNIQVTELQEQLFELQTEYDFFKQQKEDQLDELKDVVERFQKLEEEIE
jgi:predicted  nucleic acid-binding Zn-ribbon protein